MYCIVLHCIVLHCVALRCIALPCIVLCCVVLCCVVLCCFVVVSCCVVLCHVMSCCVVLFFVAFCCILVPCILYCALDRWESVFLVLLDLSAVFDTVNHKLLLSRLEDRVGLGGQVQDLATLYLTRRHQYVSFSGSSSKPRSLFAQAPNLGCPTGFGAGAEIIQPPKYKQC